MGQQPRMTVSGTNLDCPDAHVLADFYGRLLGWEVGQDQADDVTLSSPGGGPGLSFQTERLYVRPTWPARSGDQQMMMHLEIEVDDLDAAVIQALSAGAVLAEYQPQDHVKVCLDPAGHPFCLWIAT